MTIVHYEMREFPVGEAIAVQAWVYGPYESWMTTPKKISPDGVAYFPLPHDYDYGDPYMCYVHKPNWLSRRLGDTLEKRLERARERVRVKAERAKQKGLRMVNSAREPECEQ